MNKKERAKLEMREALINLRKAWIACDCAFGNFYINCNDYILGSEETEDEYPFHLSFDEMAVVEWIDGAIGRIENELKDTDNMSVFSNLGNEKAKEMISELVAKGYPEDYAFNEVYSIEFNMDEDDEDDE